MRFYEQKVVIFSRNGAHVQWLIEPEDTEISLLEIDLERSENHTGPFKTLVTLDPETDFAFTDKTVPFRPQTQEIAYRLVARDKGTGDPVHTGLSFGLAGALPLDAIEIIRQHKLLLEGVNKHRPLAGTNCTLYKKRNFGSRCRECTDSRTRRIVISNCPHCQGTGKTLGYYDPIDDVWMKIEPHPKEIQLANVGKIEPSDTQIFFTNFPVAYPGDIIVEPDEKHWRVKGINRTERHRTLVHQVLGVTQLKPDDIVHETLLHSSHR
jgi:hypothetical protein